MRYKKIFSIIFAGAFVFALFISGCSSENSSQDASDKSPSPTAVEPKGVFIVNSDNYRMGKLPYTYKGYDIKGVLAVDEDGCIYVNNKGEKILPVFDGGYRGPKIELTPNGISYGDKKTAKIGTDMSNLYGYWLTKKEVTDSSKNGDVDPKGKVCDISKYSKYYFFDELPGYRQTAE